MADRTYVLITGASKGIGLAMAMEWAARGYNILLVARNQAALDEAAFKIKKDFGVEAHCMAADLSEAGSPARILAWCEKNQYKVQVLVNNAGYGVSGAFAELSLEKQLHMMHVNMDAVVSMTHLFIPMLKKNKNAYILNIASSAAYQAVPFLSIYAASKSFVLVFTRGLRHELRGSGISVTCVCPGSTDTDFATTANVPEKALKTAEKVNMTPQAVARLAVAATLSGKAELVTGFINKLGAFLVWLFPKSLAEKTAAGLYK
jgi:short-subunit dehydrogenase